MAEGGELDKISKDRFVIGRGKHCDFVINSGKVSREHAVVVRDGGEFYVEDLGSSNGTWFNKQRIKRRQIAEEKAAKTAVQMIFPLVLFIFPGIFVVLVGPAAVAIYQRLLKK